jgi:phospholipid/cholesterol/gamma-HCH transport system substrate-binding protein
VVLALWWFSDKREATRELVLVTSSSVNGLNPQATVRYRGIVAGKVAGIGLDPGNPAMCWSPCASAPTCRSPRAPAPGWPPRASPGWPSSPSTTTVKTPPLAGVGGEPPRIRLAPGLIDEVSAASLQTLSRVRELAERLAGLASPDNLARIERTLAHLERSSQGLERTLQEAPQTLAAVRQVFSKDNLARISRSSTTSSA